MEPSLNRREREREKSLKTFEKVNLKRSRFVFKKSESRYSIDRKTVSINPNRSSQKILKEISIDRKTDWINRKSGKTSF